MTPWTADFQAFLSFTVSQSLLKFISIESVMPSSHLILCHPLLLPPSIFPIIRVLFNESASRSRLPSYWRFSFSISPSKEYSGLISFRIDWSDLLPCSPRDSQESSLAPHFKSINSLMLSHLYGPTLTCPTGQLNRFGFLYMALALFLPLSTHFLTHMNAIPLPLFLQFSSVQSLSRV